MPVIRRCKDMSSNTTTIQSTINYPVRKLRSANSSCLKEVSVTMKKDEFKAATPKSNRASKEKSCTVKSTNKKKIPTPNIVDMNQKSSSLKQCDSPLKENNFPSITKSPAKRKLIYDKENVSPGKVKKLSKPLTPKSAKKRNLFSSKVPSYNELCKVFHTSAPNKLIGRESELQAINNFIERTVNKSQPGSMYMSGAPGTGKTACLKKVLDECAACKKLRYLYFNCMSLKLSQSVFVKLSQEISNDGKSITIKESIKHLEKVFTTSKSKILLILDEMDQLESKNQDVLYKLFEMTALKNSQLILIGIANALDLTDRILPRLQSMSKCKPVLLQFPPYTKDEIRLIIEERIKESQTDVVDPSAVTFCACKVSAMSGDARKALEIMRRAVEISQQQALRSPSRPDNQKHRISVANIGRVCTEVYGSKVTNSSGISNGFPLQQKLVVCTLMLLQKEKKLTDLPMTKLYDWYDRVCNQRHVSSVSQEEMKSLCGLLESQGILALKKSKDGRSDKVCLRLQESEVEYALKDKTLVSSILADGLPK